MIMPHSKIKAKGKQQTCLKSRFYTHKINQISAIYTRILFSSRICKDNTFSEDRYGCASVALARARYNFNVTAKRRL